MMSEVTLQGILNIDKPAGLSSARVVGRIKRLLPRGIKVGHAGTLDLFATGVLLVLVGKATRQCESLMDQPKQYVATARLGATSATDDPASPPTPYQNATMPDEASVRAALARFVGTIEQRPPAFSALKISGRRASDWARQGTPVEQKTRTIRIDAIELIGFDLPDVRFRIDCGRGTYVRAVARDLGECLHCGGHLTQLCRTQVGAFRIADSVRPETLSEVIIREMLSPP